MPRLGPTMLEGTVTKWLKREGDVIQKGEPLFEVETEKVQVVIEAPHSGVLSKIVAGEGTVVPVTGVVALLAEAASEEKSELARHAANVEGLKTERVGETVPEARPQSGEIAEIREMTAQRKRISQRLSQVHLTAVHVTVTNSVDMTEMIDLRNRLGQELEKKVGTKPSYTAMIVRIVAKVLRKYPMLNSSLEDDKIKIFADINIGVAVALEDSLIVPVVYNADQRSLSEVSLFLEEEIGKAKRGSLSIDEVSNGTFTISNLGIYDVEVMTPVLNPPQSAILGVGKILEKPWVIDHQVSIRPITVLSLSFDHRVIDGALAARFLQDVKKALERPNLD